MWIYLLRRIAIASLTLLLITFVIYGLIRSMPGNPLTVAAGEMDPSRKINPLDLERMQKLYGLDRPWHQAYFTWLYNIARGDLGRSISQKAPVSKLILECMPRTLLLSVTSLLLAYGLSVPAGLYATARSGRLEERALSTVLYMLYSLPTFVAALCLLIVFYKWLDWLPLRGLTGDDYQELNWVSRVGDVLYHMILPLACMTYGALAYEIRFIKTNMHEVVRQDYIRTARAKGVSELRTIVVHAFRNTFIPLVTILGLALPGLLAGSVIIEQIFTIPGMGRLLLEAISQRDYPTIMGLMLMFSVLTLAGQLLADVLYAVVDPRVKLS